MTSLQSGSGATQGNHEYAKLTLTPPGYESMQQWKTDDDIGYYTIIPTEYEDNGGDGKLSSGEQRVSSTTTERESDLYSNLKLTKDSENLQRELN